MATPTLPRSLRLPFSHPHTGHTSSKLSKHSHTYHPNKPVIPIKPPSISVSLPIKQPRLFITRATENGAQTDETPPETATEDEQLSEVGAEIKKAMSEREATSGGSDGLFSGVAEEIGKIEWPEFSKVLGTTGVVLGVIAGSSVVLLTLNAVLAELSDQVFAGKGVQDFFAG